MNLFYIISLSLLFLAKPNAAYSVLKFGARPDGRTDSTQAFQKAWVWACKSTKRVTLDVPKGRFVVRPMYFSGPCRNVVTIRMKGTIVGPSDYRVLARSNVWLQFYNVNGLVIHGGTIDARGHSFWACRRRYGYCNHGAQVYTKKLFFFDLINFFWFLTIAIFMFSTLLNAYSNLQCL